MVGEVQNFEEQAYLIFGIRVGAVDLSRNEYLERSEVDFFVSILDPVGVGRYLCNLQHFVEHLQSTNN